VKDPVRPSVSFQEIVLQKLTAAFVGVLLLFEQEIMIATNVISIKDLPDKNVEGFTLDFISLNFKFYYYKELRLLNEAK
jgi:hypothetical protein